MRNRQLRHDGEVDVIYSIIQSKLFGCPRAGHMPCTWTNKVWSTIDTKLLEVCYWGLSVSANKPVMDLQPPSRGPLAHSLREGEARRQVWEAEYLKSYGQRFVTFYRRWWSKPSPREKKMQKGKMFVWGGLTNSWEKKWKARKKRKDISIWM